MDFKINKYNHGPWVHYQKTKIHTNYDSNVNMKLKNI